jgi:hypothetical protein
MTLKYFLKSIRRTLDKQTVQVYKIFIEELNTVKRDITTKAYVTDCMHPYYAGPAHWASGLKHRIEK